MDKPQSITVETNSASETAAIARKFASNLKPGSIVLLSGALGAGKTVFVCALVESLGGTEVSSPTFQVINHYTGRDSNIYHADLYRLDPENFDQSVAEWLNEQINEKDSIIIIEWPEHWPYNIEGNIWKISLKWLGAESRQVAIEKQK